jgi:hypothetical protein
LSTYVKTLGFLWLSSKVLIEQVRILSIFENINALADSRSRNTLISRELSPKARASHRSAPFGRRRSPKMLSEHLRKTPAFLWLSPKVLTFFLRSRACAPMTWLPASTIKLVREHSASITLPARDQATAERKAIALFN